jgi:hypothetical protein
LCQCNLNGALTITRSLSPFRFVLKLQWSVFASYMAHEHHKWCICAGYEKFGWYAPKMVLCTPPSASGVTADYLTNHRPHGSVVSEASADMPLPQHVVTQHHPSQYRSAHPFLRQAEYAITTKFLRHLHRLSQSLPDSNTHSTLTQIAINELFLCPPVLQSDGNSHTGPHLRRYPTGNHIPGQTAPCHANTRPTPHCSD